MVEDEAFSHKIDYMTNGWILRIGGASAVKDLHLQPAQLTLKYFLS